MKFNVICTIFALFMIDSSQSFKIKRQILFPDDFNESSYDIEFDNRYPARPTQPTKNRRPSRPTRLTSTSSTLATITQYSRRIEECVEGCIARTTGEYNPVCGSDQQTYHNRNRFDCAVSCGYQISIVRNQSCRSVVS